MQRGGVEFSLGLGDPRSYREWQLDAAKTLLDRSKGERYVPYEVRNTINVLTGANIWFLLSRNPHSEGCAEAAHNRFQYGERGVLLAQELKTGLWQSFDRAGKPILIMTHVRGDEEVDFEKLNKVLGLNNPIMFASNETLDQLGVGRGLVHPLSNAKLVRGRNGERHMIKTPFIHIVDPDVLSPLTVEPFTVTTNAGGYTWGVEFNPQQLFSSIVDTQISDIAKETENTLERSHLRGKINIVTGNPPESGDLFKTLINFHTRQLLREMGVPARDIYMPRIETISIPEMGYSIENRVRSPLVWAGLSREILEMMKHDPDVITLACNTTPVFTPAIRDLLEGSKTEVVTLPEVTARYLKTMGVNQVALIGIPEVAQDEHGPYLEELRKAGIAVEMLNPWALEKVVALAHAVKTGAPPERALTYLRDILFHVHREHDKKGQLLKEEKLESTYVVFALTEISQIWKGLKDYRGKIPVDPLDLAAQYIARRRLGLPFPAA